MVKLDSVMSSLQKSYIKEETIERMKLDEEVLIDFFREYISVSVSFTPLSLTLSSMLWCINLTQLRMDHSITSYES